MASPSLVAGCDISFVQGSPLAVAAVVLASLPSLQPVWIRAVLTTLECDYVPGQLSKREAAPLLSVFDLLKDDRSAASEGSPGDEAAAAMPVVRTKKGKLPDDSAEISAALSLPPVATKAGQGWRWQKKGAQLAWPRAILVDGSGILHHFKAGLAVHIGAALATPSIGVAKNLLCVHGLQRETFEREWAAMMSSLSPEERSKAGQCLDLVASTPGVHRGGIDGDRAEGVATEPLVLPSSDGFGSLPERGEVLGRALRTNPFAANPVFLSLGFAGECDKAATTAPAALSLDSACDLVLQCCSGDATLPRPIFMADHWSRFVIAKHPELRPVTTGTAMACADASGAASASSSIESLDKH